MATTEGKIVVCPQCGKKYKLKAGFAAASFACTGCSATVWVEGKPAPAAPTSKRSGGGGSKRRAGGRSGGARGKSRAGAAPTGGRRRGRREPEEDEAGEGRRSRYQQPKNNTNVIIAVAGLLIVVVAVIVILVMSNKKEAPPVPPVAQGNPAATTGDTGDGDSMSATDEGADSSATPTSNSNPAAGSGGDESAAGTDDGAASNATDGGEEAAPTATRKLGGSSTKRGELRSRYDPPADLGHLEDTPPELRKQIDDLIKNLMDPMAGRDSLEAKDKLVAIGKPAFPVILGQMARIRDTITDVDSQDERDTESSLKLADEALREMDGYLTANNKSTLRPGSHKEYIAYICRLHYKRWMTTLKDMPKMPGPFDPTQEYAAESEDYKGK